MLAQEATVRVDITLRVDRAFRVRTHRTMHFSITENHAPADTTHLEKVVWRLQKPAVMHMQMMPVHVHRVFTSQEMLVSLTDKNNAVHDHDEGEITESAGLARNEYKVCRAIP